MIGKPGDNVLVINWVANPFRADKFREAWLPHAEAVLRYGATEWAFLQSGEDPQRFDQFAIFPNKSDFERYWYSEEISDARAQTNGLYHVPLLPVWWTVEGAGAVVTEAAQA
jgi:hypothetical protein